MGVRRSDFTHTQKLVFLERALAFRASFCFFFDLFGSSDCVTTAARVTSACVVLPNERSVVQYGSVEPILLLCTKQGQREAKGDRQNDHEVQTVT